MAFGLFRCPKKGPNGLIRYWFDAFFGTRTILKPRISAIPLSRTRAENGPLIRLRDVATPRPHCASPLRNAPCASSSRQPWRNGRSSQTHRRWCKECGASYRLDAADEGVREGERAPVRLDVTLQRASGEFRKSLTHEAPIASRGAPKEAGELLDIVRRGNKPICLEDLEHTAKVEGN